MNDLTSHHQVGGAILVCSYPGMVAETQDRIGLEERLSKRVRFRILRALAILIFLLLGAASLIPSMQFRDQAWTPGLWPVYASVWFCLAWLTARWKLAD